MRRLLFAILVSLSTFCAEGRGIDVMSFNVRTGSKDDGSNSWQFRKDAAGIMIAANKPDCIGLQEALLFQIEALQAANPDYEWTGVGREDGTHNGEHTAIMWNTKTLRLLNSGTFWLSETPDIPSRSWDAKYPRTATWCLFETLRGGKKFFFVNTHFDHRGAEARRNSLVLIRELIAKIDASVRSGNESAYPVVLVGDFNLDNDNPVITDFDTKMNNARLTARKTDDSVTAHDWFARGPGHIIDYIYYEGFASCPRYRTITRSYTGPQDTAPRTVSDHYPITARLRF